MNLDKFLEACNDDRSIVIRISDKKAIVSMLDDSRMLVSVYELVPDKREIFTQSELKEIRYAIPDDYHADINNIFNTRSFDYYFREKYIFENVDTIDYETGYIEISSPLQKGCTISFEIDEFEDKSDFNLSNTAAENAIDSMKDVQDQLECVVEKIKDLKNAFENLMDNYDYTEEALDNLLPDSEKVKLEIYKNMKGVKSSEDIKKLGLSI